MDFGGEPNSFVDYVSLSKILYHKETIGRKVTLCSVSQHVVNGVWWNFTRQRTAKTGSRRTNHSLRFWWRSSLGSTSRVPESKSRSRLVVDELSPLCSPGGSIILGGCLRYPIASSIVLLCLFVRQCACSLTAQIVSFTSFVFPLYSGSGIGQE